MQIDDAIKKRQSVKRFSDKKPDWRKIIRAMDAACYAPMAGNITTVRLILVSDKEKIKELAEASQQPFVKNAHYIVAFVTDEKQIKKLYPERAERFARQQAGAAIENFLLALENFNLATCWVGYYDDHMAKRALSIPEDAVLEALFPVGIQTKVKLEKKKKTALDDITYFDKYGNKYMEGEIFVSSDVI